MPERWERELRKLGGLDVDEAPIRNRVSHGPTAERLPARRERVTAAVVAVLVFAASVVFAWRALVPGDRDQVGVSSETWPIARVSFEASEAVGKRATLSIGGSSQTGFVGASTSADDRYPYSWVNPTFPASEQPLEIPMGSELQLEGDVQVRELLFGDADRLDAGEGPDSGPMWADQPDFSEPYFLPWEEEPNREYLKFFGTWADGQVLDMYFEVRFVAPRVDLTDTGAAILVTPEPMGAVFLYGGQRSPMGVEGGTYGNTSTIGEFPGFDETAVVAKVPAGTPLEVGGEDLADFTVRAGPLPYGEGATPLNGAVPTVPGRYVLRLEVTWGGGSASLLHQIEVVPAVTTDLSPTPPPSSPGSIVIDIRRSSPETGDPEAIARFGAREQWMCPDGWNLMNPDGTTDNAVFDCGQNDVFEAPSGTPITVSGDFASLDATARLSAPGDSPRYPAYEVPSIDADSVVFLQYAVEWDDGSIASFWLLVTVAGEMSGQDHGVVVRIFELGERSSEIPVITMTYRGETRRGCTEGFEWTLDDGTRVDEASGRKGSILPQCSYEPLFRLPPGTPIRLEVPTATEVFATRTTTPFYAGSDGFGASVRWADGEGDFLAMFEVRGDPGSPEIVLDCPQEDRVEFSTPDGPRILPGGSAYIVGNLEGFVRHDVVEQMTREPDAGPGGWEGIWQVVRDGAVLAAIDFSSLGGVACRGSGIGGV